METPIDEENPEEWTTVNHQEKLQEERTTDTTALLTKQHAWNLVFCLLAWGFTVANVTIVIGTSAVLVLSLGGGNQITSMPLGTFFLGSSLSSLATPWIFPPWGRKLGFFLGIALGLVGTAIGAVSVQQSSPGLYIISTFFFGNAPGLGLALRFAAVEVVPKPWASRAVTLVVSGGVLAAFAGPESAAATRDIFGDDLTYLGVFLMTGIFNGGNLLCTYLVTFPDGGGTRARVLTKEDTDSTLSESEKSSAYPDWKALVRSRHFVVPMLMAAVGWAAMVMPMSLVRVVMKQLGYSSRASLMVIEFHFLGMYAPGFFTGNLIQRFGAKSICRLAILAFGIGLVVVFMPKESETESIAIWSLGLSLMGMAWNFAFTAGTVWLLQSADGPEERTILQAANDCLMFLFAGAWLFASSYIFEAGGSGMDGWVTLNWVVAGLVGCATVLLLLDARWDRTSAISGK